MARRRGVSVGAVARLTCATLAWSGLVPGLAAAADQTAGAWSPTTTGGRAELGLLSFPWLPLTIWIAIFLAVAALTRVARREPLQGPRSWIGWVRRNLGWRSKPSLGVRLAFAVFLAGLGTGISFNRYWDPLAYATPGGPGIGVSETRSDGRWQEDSVENATSMSVFPVCETDCLGPRYVYRLAPGAVYTFVVTVQNTGPLPLTLLGRLGEDPTAAVGLALLRDPSLGADESANLLPFSPVALAPGGAVTVAIVNAAPTCADPTAKVDSWPDQMQAWGLAYEVLGWRRTGTVWPHFSVDVLGCD